LAGVPTQGMFVVTKILSGAATAIFLDGINNVGQVVGTYDDGGDVGDIGFIYDHHTGYEWLGDNRYPAGINDLGQVVCESEQSQGFIYQYGIFSPLNMADYPTWPEAINNLGHVVGIYYVPAPEPDPGVSLNFLYRGGEYLSIALPGLFVEGINDSGKIAGYGVPPEGGGFIFDSLSNTYETSLMSEIYGINNIGNLVGRIDDGWSFLDATDSIQVQIQMGVEQVLTDINDFDQIAGFCEPGPEGGAEFGFVLTPCPFPWPFGHGIYPPFLPERPPAPGVSSGSGVSRGTGAVPKAGQGTASGKGIPKKKSGTGK
ncbi:MAG: hypothetical protein C3F08_02700, partial [Candidatus Methylomirabilota bacterium]